MITNTNTFIYDNSDQLRSLLEEYIYEDTKDDLINQALQAAYNLLNIRMDYNDYINTLVNLINNTHVFTRDNIVESVELTLYFLLDNADDIIDRIVLQHILSCEFYDLLKNYNPICDLVHRLIKSLNIGALFQYKGALHVVTFKAFLYLRSQDPSICDNVNELVYTNDCFNNQINLSEFRNLTCLRVHGCTSKMLLEINTLTTLEKLYVRFIYSDNTRSLNNLNKLQVLELEDCSNGQIILDSVHNELKELYLKCTNVCNLSKFANLNILTITESSINDLLINSVNVSNIIHLYLISCKYMNTITFDLQEFKNIDNIMIEGRGCNVRILHVEDVPNLNTLIESGSIYIYKEKS